MRVYAKMILWALAALLAGPGISQAQDLDWNQIQETIDTSKFKPEFLKSPPLSPPYMVDNTRNTHNVAPINGESNGAVWPEHGSRQGYMKALKENNITIHSNASEGIKAARAESSSYWIPQLAPLGVAPRAGKDYKFYRNVVDYGADNTGAKPADEAINAAIQDGDRCGEECGNTFVQGALVYFPPGTYLICTPIIQYYYTQFVGDAVNRPTLKGCSNFTGIAMIDVDPYIPNQAAPDGGGVNWYINQNQFFRQIRNFVFDMKDMPAATDEHGQQLVPTGIHWQVSQACSLQNLRFEMPQASSSSSENITHVGIFTENGSGGFVSDLEFEGGAIGWRVGSQQYTAIGLRFKNCITAVQMIWDWGFNWQRIHVEGGTIAFNISGQGGLGRQGIGSVSIIDSEINNVPIGILTNGLKDQAPNIVIDNTVFSNVGAIVQLETGSQLLEGGGSQTVQLWAHGRRYEGKSGERSTGHLKNPPQKSSKLLDGGRLFTRLRPQYEQLSASSFLIATEHGCSNDATGDNTAAINSFLQQAVAQNKIAYFPAGIYNIQDTVDVPVGSRVQGTSWSQWQASGKKFQDMKNPRVVVRVGKEGDSGVLEISDMLFTVKGNTAGAIMMEWNVRESSQGSAAMWDSHIRVGGGIGTDLDAANCPKLAFSDACICASMLLHVTKTGSGYFENVWAWIADHDNDMSLYWEVDSLASQISLYGARGILVESQGPCWFYGSGSEHAVLYQYQLHKAKDIYLGHIQTESPYFQPVPPAPGPFDSSVGLFAGDPTFEDCKTKSCKEAWGLRIIESEGVSIHSAGLYSWFTNYEQQCLKTEDCQQRIMDVSGSTDVAIYNIFVKGAQEIATTSSYTIEQSENQQGYTSEISLWLPEDDAPEVVYIGTELYQKPTAACNKPCIMVLAPSPLPSTTTISIKPYTTSLQVGSTVTTITVTPKPVTTDKIPLYNVNVSAGATNGAFYRTTKSLALDDVIVTLSHVEGAETTTTTRHLQLPPWPQINDGPPENWNSTTGRNTHQDGRKTTTLPPSQGTTTTTTHIPPPPPTTTVFPILYLDPIYEDVPPQCTGRSCPPMNDKKNDDDDHNAVVWIRIKCDELWFFNFCIDVNGLRVKGWEFPLPKGQIGPGPPPFVPKIRGWHLVLPPILPPWPKIDVGHPGLGWGEKDPSCEDNKVSVPVELYTRSYGLSVSNGQTVTTTTRTITETAYETGCPTPEWTSTAACGAKKVRRTADNTVPNTHIPAPTTPVNARSEHTGDSGSMHSDSSEDDPEWEHDFDCDEDKSDVIIHFGEDSIKEDDDQVYNRLWYDSQHFDMKFEVFQHPSTYVLFTYVWKMPRSLRDKFSVMPGVAHIRAVKGPLDEAKGTRTSRSVSGIKDKPKLAERSSRDNATVLQHRVLQHRGENLAKPRQNSAIWWLSQVSSYPGEAWDYDGTDGGDPASPYFYEYYHEESLGQGQVVYLLEEGMDTGDPEFSEADILLFPEFPKIGFPADNLKHGTAVAKLIVGKTFGIASKATMVAFDRVGFAQDDSPRELFLIALLRIIEHIEASVEEGANGLGDIRSKCVINMSFSLPILDSPEYQLFSKKMEDLARHLQDDLGCLMVASAGNRHLLGWSTDDSLWGYLRYSGTFPDFVISGASGKEGYKAKMSQIWSSSNDQGILYAPGLHMEFTGSDGALMRKTGTSFSAPLTSGLAAYLRALDSKWKAELRDPGNLVKMIRYLSRKIHVFHEEDEYEFGGPPSPSNNDDDEDHSNQPRIIWNGQVKNENCLLSYESEESKAICDRYMKDIPDSLDNWNPPEMPDPCDSVTGSKRDLTCKANSGGNGAQGFQWSQGSPAPTCTGGCGTLCTGYYCSPHPTGHPPDYYEHSTTQKGDGGLTGLPHLTQTPTPMADCTGRIKPTTICNGSGGRMACVTSSYCSSSAPPTATPTATDMLCQLNRGCKDYPCPDGEYGWCSGGHCKCRDQKLPDGQECLSNQNCQSYSCKGGKTPFCDKGYCGCKNKECSSVGDCSDSCNRDERATCSSNGCTCQAFSFSMTRTIKCSRLGQGCFSEAVLTDGTSKWTISNARDGCRSPKGFVDLCIDESRNRMKFRLSDDVPRCLIGGELVAEGECGENKGFRCSSAVWQEVKCAW